VALVNAQNAGGVAHSARLSTPVLIELLDISGRQLAAVFATLDPHATALYPVSWAGELVSETWMDIGREYTEHWHHQMQIRDAVGQPRLLEPKWMLPLLDMSVRALPRAYAELRAAAGTTITLAVTGETAGDWSLVRGHDQWQVRTGRPAAPDAIVTIAADDVWRLFYNALPDDDRRQRVTVAGKSDLAAPLWRARSVIV